MAKHFDVEIEDNRFAYRRREDAIAAEKRVGGICIIRTSVPKQELDDAATVAAYKSLSQVEQTFRCFKTVDLHLRPVRPRLDGRIRSDVLLCMLAYYVASHLRRARAPLLSGEDDPAAAVRCAARRSPRPHARQAPNASSPTGKQRVAFR